VSEGARQRANARGARIVRRRERARNDGVSPERAIHVGDTPAADVAGARAAGVRPVLIDPYDLHADADCLRARSLAAVLDMLPA